MNRMEWKKANITMWPVSCWHHGSVSCGDARHWTHHNNTQTPSHTRAHTHACVHTYLFIIMIIFYSEPLYMLVIRNSTETIENKLSFPNTNLLIQSQLHVDPPVNDKHHPPYLVRFLFFFFFIFERCSLLILEIYVISSFNWLL